MDWLSPSIELGSPQALLATTFDLDPDFVELDFMPSLLRVPAWDDRQLRSRVQLEVGLGRLDAAVLMMEGRRFRGRPKSLRLHVSPALREEGGVLHAKVTLMVFENAVRLVVSSANLTTPGYRLNREVAVPLTATEKAPEPGALIREALDSMEHLLAPWWSSSASTVVARAREALDDMKAPKKLSGERFLWGGGDEPLWTQFLALWPKREPVKRIVVVSPFWSEETGSGPLIRLVGELKRRRVLAQDVSALLVTAAAPGTNQVPAPSLPTGYGTYDFSKHGISVEAAPVLPIAGREDAASAEILRERPLHAKCLILQGPETSLAYLGSANFSLSAWGWGTQPNIEAGIAFSRQGKDRRAIDALTPPLGAPAIRLNGDGTARLVVPAADDDVLPWPRFLRFAELRASESTPENLELVLELITQHVPSTWTIGYRSDGTRTVGSSTQGVARFALSPDDVRHLLRNQAINVWWADCGVEDGIAFPVNVDPGARERMPFGDPNALPGEDELVAFFQGRIAVEDLAGAEIEGSETAGVGTDVSESRVDTSQILSYQVRAFVEALPGVRDEIERSLVNTASIRLALLGPVSPVALSTAIRKAALERGRSPTAAAFQLVELSAVLRRCGDMAVDERLEDAWRAALNEAQTRVTSDLDAVRAAHAILGPPSPFAKYERAALEPTLEGTP